MHIDPNNHIVKLCARGMELEGANKTDEAGALFVQAWNDASNDFEKFTAAHYVARHQKSTMGKLEWDNIALELALKINNDSVKGAFPSLYLNVAKCYEDLEDLVNAKLNYELALTHAASLSDDGYGQLIRGGILKGIERVTK